MSISPLAKQAIVTEAKRVQKEADQKEFDDLVQNIEQRQMTPFERANTIGSIWDLAKLAEKK